ncbi:potassium channel family protein [Spirochaeta lutea]|uniref:RCK C-terminal domain-containing protein n=1 Tax=Spirochaeta lutea TaxID=1480694 RepID=A0A098QT24_9SPIO|nr:TrkA family potassium uptake protein [Spirochaeta lutea]KGE70824.1 hypothetical protein DC28_15190 [Spirochaeta lutea]
MKQFVIIGLGSLGKRMIEELGKVECEVMVIDQDPELIELYKEQVSASFVANALQEEVIKKLVPSTIDAAIIDLGGKIEVSVLVTNYLKKLGVHRIIAHAESDEHGEILQLVGATEVIFPTLEAAKRITPLLVSSEVFNYLPISSGLVIAEVRVPRIILGKTLIEANLRRDFGITVIAIRKEHEEEFDFVSSDYHLGARDVLLLAGKAEELTRFSGISPNLKKMTQSPGLLKSLFGWKK